MKNNKLTITTVGFFQGISKMARYKIKMEKVLVTCFWTQLILDIVQGILTEEDKSERLTSLH